MTNESDDRFARLRAELDKKASSFQGETRTGDIAGFWAPDHSPCFCIPRYAVARDPKKYDRRKPSIMVVVTLTADCAVFNRDDDGDSQLTIAAAGDTIGIWYKPGMKGLSDCADVPVCIRQSGKTRDVGKGEPMKLYDVIATSAKRNPLFITEDTRESSAAAPLPFPKRADAGTPSGYEPDIPF